MTASHISGPSVVSGNPTTAQTNPEAGPSIFYQGTSILDTRLPYQNGQTGRGALRAFSAAPCILSVDATPSAFSATMIAAAATATSGVPLTLATTNIAGRGVNFPIIPTGVPSSASSVIYTLALDPAFTTIATTAGSPIATTTASNLALNARLVPGITLLVGSAASSWQSMRLLSVSGTNLTFDVPAAATNAAAQVATATGQFRTDNLALSFTPAVTAGAARVFDARGAIARGVSVTSSAAGDTGYTVTVRGYDQFLAPMSETITVTPGGVAYGNKCFSFISSVTPTKSGGGTTTGTLSIGTSDLIGFHTRSDAWEYSQVYWAGALMVSSTGWVAADTTMPATSVTKDVRGAVQLSSNGPNGSFLGGSPSNGARRLVMSTIVPLDNLMFSTTATSVSLFGVPQA